MVVRACLVELGTLVAMSENNFHYSIGSRFTIGFICIVYRFITCFVVGLVVICGLVAHVVGAVVAFGGFVVTPATEVKIALVYVTKYSQ